MATMFKESIESVLDERAEEILKLEDGKWLKEVKDYFARLHALKMERNKRRKLAKKLRK